MCDIDELAGIVFSGLSSLVIEDVADQDGVIVVRAATAGGPVPCPRCRSSTGHVHGYYVRTVADVPADGRPVVLHVRVRRMRCPVPGCPVQTFREQAPGILDRYQRRTARLAGQAGEAVRRLAGRAGAGLLTALGVPLSRHTALRLLLAASAARSGRSHGLAAAVGKEAAAHASCWAAAGPPAKEGTRAETTAQRWREVHGLLGKGTGLLECSRRPGLSVNTVTRYARVAEPERLVRAPQYRPTLAGPYRDHLRARRAEDPAVPVLRLLAEIREQGYTGSMNLLYRYISQGRVESNRPHLSSRRVARLLLTRPAALSGAQQALLSKLTATCPEMTSLAGLVRSFAALLNPDPGNDGTLQEWTRAARAADLPSLHAFTRGLDLDMAAATAAVTLPFHNGRTEGVNTKRR